MDQTLGLMTPHEAFNPDGGEGMGSFGPEPEEQDELSEPEPAEEEEAGEAGEGAAETTPMDAMSEAKKKQLEQMKEAIKKGKLKGKKLDEALKALGYSGADIQSLMNVKVQGRAEQKSRTGARGWCRTSGT